MGDLNFTKATDEKHEIELESHLISASWTLGLAFVGLKAKFEVRTVFVGNGAKIKVTGKTAKGKKLGKVKGKMQNNIFTGEFEIPDKVELDDQIYFEVDISDNGLNGESAKIPVYPQPKAKNMKWSAEEARRGDVLTLSADMEDVKDGTEAKIVIYEYDADGGHDIITDLKTAVKDSKIELKWEYEYHEDTDELPTKEEVDKYGGSYNPPEYFFTINIGEFELGKKDQDSGILNFKDWMDLSLVDDDGNPMPDVEYEITLPDGEKKTGNLDSEGKAKVENIPPGVCTVKYKGVTETVEVKNISATESGTESSQQADEEDKLMTESAKAEKKADESKEEDADDDDGNDDSQSSQRASDDDSSDATSATDFKGEVED